MHVFSLSLEGPCVQFQLQVGKLIFEKQVRCAVRGVSGGVLLQKIKINRLIQLLKHNFNLKDFFLIRFNVCHALPVILHSREFVQRFPVRMSLLQHAWQLLLSHRGDACWRLLRSGHRRKSSFSISLMGLTHHPCVVIASVSHCPYFSRRKQVWAELNGVCFGTSGTHRKVLHISERKIHTTL